MPTAEAATPRTSVIAETMFRIENQVRQFIVIGDIISFSRYRLHTWGAGPVDFKGPWDPVKISQHCTCTLLKTEDQRISWSAIAFRHKAKRIGIPLQLNH
jgi:hypothetical protein